MAAPHCSLWPWDAPLAAALVFAPLPCIAIAALALRRTCAAPRSTWPSGAAAQVTQLLHMAVPASLLFSKTADMWRVFSSLDRHAEDGLAPLVEEKLLGALECLVPGHNIHPLLIVWLLPPLAALLLIVLAMVHKGLSMALSQKVSQDSTQVLPYSANAELRSTRCCWCRASSGHAGGEAILAAAVVALLTHVRCAQAGFRAFFCAAGLGRSRCGGNDSGMVAWRTPLSLLALLTNVALPTLGLVMFVRHVRRRRGIAFGGDPTGAAALLLPCEPWLEFHLAGDLLAVAGAELAVASASADRGRWLGHSWVQLMLLAQLLVVLCPPWLLDARLARVSQGMLVAVLVGSEIRNGPMGFASGGASWAWPPLVFFLAAYQMQHLWVAAATRRLKAKTAYTEVALDFAQLAISIVTAEDLAFSSVDANDRAALHAAAAIVRRNLPRTSSPDVMSAEFVQNRLEYFISVMPCESRSPHRDRRPLSGSWVGPLQSISSSSNNDLDSDADVSSHGPPQPCVAHVRWPDGTVEATPAPLSG
eukprot:NODE_3125_length_2088_cov_9.379908.p1 GENE.NODE_3125_length_2088_cov_9.379908~~NODE_3125_length_2088_cov_9.379908.p1  ORF type:complete len:533 (-),score=84.93 NODE_3125_length_2088_cov_9.379908:392-1990(-)